MTRAFYRSFWAPANLASNVVSLVTIAASVLGFLFAPSIWFVIAAAAGVIAALALLWIGNERYRVYGLIQWMDHENAIGWDRDTGVAPLRDRTGASLWLSSDSSRSAPAHARSDALRMAGYLDAARAELDAANPATPTERARIELSRFEADFDERGDGDLGPVRAAAADLPTDEERLMLAHVAFYEAIMDHAAGRDWLAKLRHARRQLGPFSVPFTVRANPIFVRTVIPVGLTIGLIAIVSGISDFVTEFVG